MHHFYFILKYDYISTYLYISIYKCNLNYYNKQNDNPVPICQNSLRILSSLLNSILQKYWIFMKCPEIQQTIVIIFMKLSWYSTSISRNTSKFRELWSPAWQQIWPWIRPKVTTWYHQKGLQRTHMPSIKVLPVIVQKLWRRLRFLWQTDGQTDGKSDLKSPRFRKSGGTIRMINWKQVLKHKVNIRQKSKCPTYSPLPHPKVTW